MKKIKTLIIWSLFISSCAFSILSYNSSDKIIKNQFIVTEKIKTDDMLYLKYVSNDNIESIYIASEREYIDAKESSNFIIYDYQKMFYIYIFLAITFFISWITVIGLLGIILESTILI